MFSLMFIVSMYENEKGEICRYLYSLPWILTRQRWRRETKLFLSLMKDL